MKQNNVNLSQPFSKLRLIAYEIIYLLTSIDLNQVFEWLNCQAYQWISVLITDKVKQCFKTLEISHIQKGI